jgi:hypothetical protein
MRCTSLTKLRFSCTLDPNQPKTNASRLFDPSRSTPIRTFARASFFI